MLFRVMLGSLVVLFAAVPFTASAAVLPIKGNYGNKDGCLYARTQETNGSDTFMLLTPKDMTTATAYCEFKTLLKTKGRSYTVAASCQAEGETDPADLELQISDTNKQGYSILFKDGTHWGPLKPCK